MTQSVWVKSTQGHGPQQHRHQQSQKEHNHGYLPHYNYSKITIFPPCQGYCCCWHSSSAEPPDPFAYLSPWHAIVGNHNFTLALTKTILGPACASETERS